MAGLLLCIIAIIIGFSYPENAEPEIFSSFKTVTALVFFSLACTATGLLASMRMKNCLRLHSSRRRAVESYAMFRKISWLMVLGLYSILIHLFDYPYLIRSENGLGLGDIPLITPSLILLPFFIFTAGNLAGLYSGDKLLRGSSWGMFSFQAFFMRQLLIPVFPFLAFSTAFELLVSIPGIEEKLYVFPWLLTTGYALFITILFSFAPLLFRLLWKVSSLPDGPLRRKVEELAKSSNVKYRDILIWHTGGSNIANAMVTGIFARMRYIFVTDALMGLLPEDEIVAVLAHEIGHAKHRHMQIYLFLAISFIAFINSVEQQIPMLMQWIGSNLSVSLELLYVGYAFGILILFWGVIFGFSSRRFEQAADVFAAEKVSPAIFGSALARIGLLSGGPRTMSSWRHFSIDQRVRFMEKAATGEGLGIYRRNMRTAFSIVGIVAVLGISAFGYDIWNGFDSRNTYERSFLYSYFNKDYERAVEIAQEAIEKQPGWGRAYYLKAGALDEIDRFEEAEKLLDKAIQLDKQALFYYVRAEMLIKLDRLQEAMEMLHEAVALEPDNIEFAKKLQSVLKSLNKKEKLKNGNIPGNGNQASE